jgi:tetratricopeptide (TPR) repeat protein
MTDREDSAPAVATGDDPHSQQRLSRILRGVVVLLGVVAYCNALQGPFVFDDDLYIADSHVIKQPLGQFDPFHRHNNRPVFFASLKFNYLFSGASEPFGYHLFNVAVHLGGAIVLFGLVRRTLLLPKLCQRFHQQAPWLALAVAAIWVVHPLQTQAVNYIVQRCETMMAFCYLLFLYGMVRSIESERRWSWYAVAIMAFIIGIGCKEVMITAPLIALLFDRIFLASSWRDTIRERGVVYVAIVPAWLWLWFNAAGGIKSNVVEADRQTLVAASESEEKETDAVAEKPNDTEPKRSTAAQQGQLTTPWQYLCTQPRVISHYIRLAFWPRPLCLDYKGGWQQETIADAILPGLAVITLLLASIAALRFCPPIGFLGVAFFVILAPTSSVLPLQDLIFEHRMYLPLAALITIAIVGGSIMLERLLAALRINPNARAYVMLGVASMAVIACLALTISRNRDYQRRSAIWQSVLGIYPNNVRALQHLVSAYFSEENSVGARAALSKLNEITGADEQASLKPWVLNSEGRLLVESGNYEAAGRVFEEAIILGPRDTTLRATLHKNLGVAYEKLGRLPDAIDQYRTAIRLMPRSAVAQNSLGYALFKSQEFQEAGDVLRTAVRLDPNNYLALNNLGLVLAYQRKPADAIAYFQRAVAQEPEFIAGHDNLASAYIDTRQNAKAVKSLERAHTLAIEQDDQEYVADIQLRIDRIRASVFIPP